MAAQVPVGEHREVRRIERGYRPLRLAEQPAVHPGGEAAHLRQGVVVAGIVLEESRSARRAPLRRRRRRTRPPGCGSTRCGRPRRAGRPSAGSGSACRPAARPPRRPRRRCGSTTSPPDTARTGRRPGGRPCGSGSSSGPGRRCGRRTGSRTAWCGRRRLRRSCPRRGSGPRRRGWPGSRCSAARPGRSSGSTSVRSGRCARRRRSGRCRAASRSPVRADRTARPGSPGWRRPARAPGTQRAACPSVRPAAPPRETAPARAGRRRRR